MGSPNRVESSIATLGSGVKISYVLSEGEREETILFVHGLGAYKEYLLPALDYPDLTHYNVLIPDLVGFGDSSAPENFSYRMEDQAKALYRLLDRLGLDGRVVLILHSMGGPVGVSLAEMLGERVAAIVYAEGNLDLGDCFFSNLVISEHTFEGWVEQGFAQRLNEYKAREDQAAGHIAEGFKKAGPQAIYRASEDLVEVSKADTLKDRLVDLKVPVLAVFGEANRGKFTSEGKLGEAFPLLYIPEAGHIMMVDNPDAFYRGVIEFLNDTLIN